MEPIEPSDEEMFSEASDDEPLIVPATRFIVKTDEGPLEVDPNRGRPKEYHSPSEALATHMELLQWLQTDAAIDHVSILHKRNWKLNDEEMGELYNGYDPDKDDSLAAGYVALMRSVVNHNNTMYVSGEMVRTLQGLIQDFGEEPFHPEDVPDSAGVVLFEEKIQSDPAIWEPDVEEGDSELLVQNLSPYLTLRGFAYRVVGSGSTMTIKMPSSDPKLPDVLYSLTLKGEHADDPRDQAFDKNGGIILWPLYDAGDMLVTTGAWERVGEPPVLPMSLIAVPFGPFINIYRESYDYLQMRQIIVTLFRLIWQHIITEGRMDRGERRRVDRVITKYKRVPEDGEHIKIRYLRRIESIDAHPAVRERDEEGGWSLTYRIIVRGHPRQQHYPTLGPAYDDNGDWNPDSHRKIWIDAHIRGPEDGPLVLKHSMDAVIR